LCRYLLHGLDGVNGSNLTMTHDLIGMVLGVRRESVTVAARKLQNDGLIKYVRGQITVLDRAGIESRACVCYCVVSKEYGRLFPGFRDGGRSRNPDGEKTGVQEPSTGSRQTV
jgi:hypothetical protein